MGRVGMGSWGPRGPGGRVPGRLQGHVPERAGEPMGSSAGGPGALGCGVRWVCWSSLAPVPARETHGAGGGMGLWVHGPVGLWVRRLLLLL